MGGWSCGWSCGDDGACVGDEKETEFSAWCRHVVDQERILYNKLNVSKKIQV